MTFESISEACVKWKKDLDNAILGEIKQKAIEHGIKTEYVLNEKAIINALEKQIPKKPIADNDGWLCCPNCHETFPMFDSLHKRLWYCGGCGQRLDWSKADKKGGADNAQ